MSERPPLTFVIYSPFPGVTGGRESWLFNLLKRLPAGKPISVISLASANSSKYAFGRNDIGWIRIPSFRYWNTIGAIARKATFGISDTLNMAFFALAGGIAIVRSVPSNGVVVALHSHVDLLPLVLAKIFRKDIRIVSSVRGRVGVRLESEGRLFRARLFKRFEAFLLRRADRVLVNGFDTLEYIRPMRSDAVVVPNGVDVTAFHVTGTGRVEDKNRIDRLKQNGVFVILSVATLRDVKGIRPLIEAASILKRTQSIPFAVLLAGKGNPHRYALLARRSGVEAETCFIGERTTEELPFLYRSADTVACLSGGGGMSLTALEAMAAGCPIVAWDTDTYRQLLTHGTSALLAPWNRADALAEHLVALAHDKARRTRLGAAAAASAGKHDWPLVQQIFLEAL